MSNDTDRIGASVADQARAAFQEGDLDRSESLAKTILSDRETRFLACHLLGAIALRRKLPFEAVKWVELAIEDGCLAPDILNTCGEAYRQLGELDKAFSRFEQALKIDNTNPLPHFNLGLVMRSLGHSREAEHFFQTAIVFSPSMARAHFELAELYREEGHGAESEREYRGAIQLASNQKEMEPERIFQWKIRLASLLREGGAPVAANEILEDVVGKAALGSAYLELALGQFELSWEASARSNYLRAIALQPDLSINKSPRVEMPRVVAIKNWCEAGNGKYTLLSRSQYLTLPRLKVIPEDATSRFMAGLSGAPELFCATLNNAEVLPLDFAVISNGNFFADGVINWTLHYVRKGRLARHESDDLRLLLDIPSSCRQHQGGCVLIGGGEDQYEWLFQSLARLWVVEQMPELASLPLIVPAGLTEDRLAMLDYIGIARERLLALPDDEVLRTDVLHVPSLLVHGNWMAPVALQFLRRRFRTHSERGSRRLYLSRSRYSDRRLANESELIGILQKHQFEIIDVSRMDSLALMSIFRQAEVVLSIDDDTLANLVVSPQGTHVGIIATGGAYRPRAHFVCGQLAIDVTYLIGEIAFDSNPVHALCDVVLPMPILNGFLEKLAS